MEKPAPYRMQCYVTELPDAQEVNRLILNGFSALRDDPAVTRSHWFGGRYENTYVPQELLPALQPVLEAARRGAARYLGRPELQLAVGFWFNEMGPGQATLPHRHDEDDELVSGVYYVQVPGESGELVLTQGAVVTRVTPAPGRFVFFPPHIQHEVTVNRSGEKRLSIGMNFGIHD